MACVASTCRRQFGWSASSAAISGIGWMVPSSLSTAQMATSTVSGRSNSRTSSGSTVPSRPMESGSISQPRSCRAVRLPLTEECSSGVEMICLPICRDACAMPLMARLFASVAPEVKMTSAGDAPVSAAICSVTRAISSRAALPAACTEFGLAGKRRSISQNRSSTAGSAGAWAA